MMRAPSVARLRGSAAFFGGMENICMRLQRYPRPSAVVYGLDLGAKRVGQRGTHTYAALPKGRV